MEITNEKQFYEWLGSEYRILRENRGLKQKEVAERAGISATELSKFERYGVKLSAYRIALLFKIVGLSFEDFVSGSEKKNLNSLSMATS